MMCASYDDWDEFLLTDVTFACSMPTDEDGGCISFGNQELAENV
jgi:hypothetical protein